MLPKGGTDEFLWEKFDPPNNIKKIKKQLSNESINYNNMVENSHYEYVENVTKHKRSKEKIVENKKIYKHVSDESLASLEKSLVDLRRGPKAIKSRGIFEENIQAMNQKNVQTESNNNNCSSMDDNILGVNLSSILLKISGWIVELR